MAKSGRTKVPRASVAVSILRDPDFIALVAHNHNGRDAGFLFLSLIVAAKDQENGGEFDLTIEVLASLVRWPRPGDVKKALATLEAQTDWIDRSGPNKFTVRNFKKWNPGDVNWGGSRPGSGRPPKNQDDSLFESTRNQDDSTPQVGNGNGNGEGLSGAGGSGEGAKRKQRAADPIWDCVVALFELNPKVDSHRTRAGRIVRELKALEATPDEIIKRTHNLESSWPEGTTVTPEALIKHWGPAARAKPRGDRRSNQPDQVSRVKAKPGKYDGVAKRASDPD